MEDGSQDLTSIADADPTSLAPLATQSPPIYSTGQDLGTLRVHSVPRPAHHHHSVEDEDEDDTDGDSESEIEHHHHHHSPISTEVTLSLPMLPPSHYTQHHHHHSHDGQHLHMNNHQGHQHHRHRHHHHHNDVATLAAVGGLVGMDAVEEVEDRLDALRGDKKRIYAAGKMMFFASFARDWRGLIRFKELEMDCGEDGYDEGEEEEELPHGNRNSKRERVRVSIAEKLQSLRDLELELQDEGGGGRYNPWTYVGPYYLHCPSIRHDHEIDPFYCLDDVKPASSPSSSSSTPSSSTQPTRNCSSMTSMFRIASTSTPFHPSASSSTTTSSSLSASSSLNEVERQSNWMSRREWFVEEREREAMWENMKYQIAKCDVLYARITEEKDCYFVFAEIGLAAALGKRVYIDWVLESHDSWLFQCLARFTKGTREEYVTIPWALYK
jgi:hypothetical protein